MNRTAKVVGLFKQGTHNRDCACEQCGPAFFLALSEYEAQRLQAALEQRDGRDTGDWHGQIRFKLAQALGPWNPPA